LIERLEHPLRRPLTGDLQHGAPDLLGGGDVLQFKPAGGLLPRGDERASRSRTRSASTVAALIKPFTIVSTSARALSLVNWAIKLR
jgi:hypothetical protein